MRFDWINRLTGTGRLSDRVMRTDEMQQQLLYEYWLKRDTWSLRDEAVPLLLGLDPASADPEEPAVQETWDSVKSDVKENRLSIYNRQAPADSWSVAPAVIYRWASENNIPLPAPFSELMEFILQAVKREGQSDVMEDEGSRFNAENESILGAALALINRFPDACFESDGGIDIHKTIILMKEHATDLFGTPGPEFSYERVYDLLKRWADRL